MAFEEYIAEEIAHDAVAGLMTRREALRRLALIGLSATAAAGLLAACSDDDEDATGPDTSATTPSTLSRPEPGAAPAGVTETFGSDGALKGVFAAATPANGSPAKGSVLVIHENRGLTAHFQGFPKRLAADGYNALAIDLLSRDGGTPIDEGAAQAALSAAPRERLVADALEGVTELLRRHPDAKVGVMGFCFGGGMTWSVLAAGEDRIAAAIPFYGPLPDPHDFSKTKAAVLAVYGEMDTGVNGSRDAATAALGAAGLNHEIKTFPGVGHAFFNDTGPRYNEAAAKEAYQDVLRWFGRHLA